ncbi:rhamnosyltransferase WsaF family glycosyltransferase [Paenibacillus macquariensis]|uniref:Uncharacterized protein n=1 Tax=Paenibacillus macquariensis TaxID=948756 RepID=A0ABY1K6J0_9BACL|nr:hypothetical protein [Paenibacillus macquariensis]MEC0093593.1 hypothetical protein [Paenibacillus macquariensis]OAB35586.1 hypothetical protein PMSM_10090 [Paenibacillus macquariensis subsp. macquariensis]SIR33061.1 hypothetical protein SAMN05421578_11122 [Paenibacillus macquariensis]
MSKFIEFVIRKARGSNTLKRAYKSTVSSYLNTHVSEITPFNPIHSSLEGKRINLLVPSINKEHVFGGISTAINFYDELVLASQGYSRRIITTDACPESEDLDRFPNYTLVTCEVDAEYRSQIVPFNDRYNKTIPVSKDDIFIATSWWTAYFAQRIVKWQSEYYGQEIKKVIYFIQDFEPGFYPWSSQYSLAESTYKYKGPQIAIFNSSLLMDFVIQQGYSFTEKYSFEPKLNTALKERLVPVKDMNKQKKILIYGRPSVARNAFTLIVEALRTWVWSYPNASQWEIISAGEQHNDIDIGNGVTIKSKGKMSLDEYAEELKSSAVGLSLMISPHPSYPPLEMAHFGVLVLTNNYANKNLSNLHGNITSLEELNTDVIANALSDLCAKFEYDNSIGTRSLSSMESYINNKKQFDFIDDVIKNL